MVCVQERIKLRRKIVKKVNNLEELKNAVGNEIVDKCFTEYMMLMVAKTKKVDELLADLEDMNDTDMFSAADLKNRLM